MWCWVEVESDGTVLCELFGTFVGIVEGDDLGTGGVEAKTIGVEFTMDLGVGGLR